MRRPCFTLGAGMAHPKDDLGRWGEAQAAKFLKSRGLRVLARNVELAAGEIDLVARDGKTLVFVEVKTRTEADYGGPLGAVDARKRRKLATLARLYLAANRLDSAPCRFDVVGVVQKLLSPEPEIEYIPNAFDASGRPL